MSGFSQQNILPYWTQMITLQICPAALKWLPYKYALLDANRYIVITP